MKKRRLMLLAIDSLALLAVSVVCVLHMRLILTAL